MENKGKVATLASKMTTASSCSTEGQKWLKQRLNNISSSNDNFVKRLLTSKIAQNCKMFFKCMKLSKIVYISLSKGPFFLMG